MLQQEVLNTSAVLVVGAGQDRITPAAVVQKVAAKYGPVATYHEYANHAHWILSGPGWREIAADTAAWLEEVL
jgi:alpha-beta hydrolase superfamily lysophospholipase